MCSSDLRRPHGAVRRTRSRIGRKRWGHSSRQPLPVKPIRAPTPCIKSGKIERTVNDDPLTKFLIIFRWISRDTRPGDVAGGAVIGIALDADHLLTLHRDAHRAGVRAVVRAGGVYGARGLGHGAGDGTAPRHL